ncbi:MAG: RNase adapter RapZ [Candidatus Aminicenantes bacterium]|nr:MAG: RNase adapter RapZ [Candidatus Aminicenantes bacterium]
MKKDRKRDTRFLIITGLSGSGKTVVGRFVEDLGYYCIDNLPTKLIPRFVDLWTRKEVEIEKVALVVDIREIGFTKEFPKVLQSIREKVQPYLIFLEASDEVLFKRFSESRRPHPLASTKSVREGIALERKRLAKIKNLADDVLDTSFTNLAELKEILTREFLQKKRQSLQIVVVSFGYKYGIPLDSDLVFDTRFLPNPHYIDAMREMTGKSKRVKEYVLQAKESQSFLIRLMRFVDYMMPKFEDEGKSYLTIAMGCTGGRHRSVVLADRLKEHLKGQNYRVRAYHRDIFK